MKLRINKTKINKKNGFLLGFLLTIIVFLLIWVNVSMIWKARYDKDTFNCVDMSSSCGGFFKSIGIPVQMVYGSNPGTHKGHCWLLLFGCLEFESTTLFPRFFDKNCDRYNVDIIEEIKDI
jgi:hypothetical protein